MPDSATAPAYPALTLRARASILVLVVLQFLFGFGPVWHHLMHWDRAIAWSYASIPVLVTLALAWKRRLSFRTAFLHTLELCFVKFAVTASILVVLLTRSSSANLPGAWVAAPVEALGISAGSVPKSTAPHAPPPAQSADVHGVVSGADGRPVPGALVYVASGLEAYAFPVPSEPLVLRDEGGGFVPALAAVTVGQRLNLESGDGKLHSFRAERSDHRWVVNVPIPGGVRTLTFDEPKGIVQVRCTVHPAEPASHLGIFSHPFFAIADSQGAFFIPRVPAVPVTYAAFGPSENAAAALVVRIIR